LIEMMAVSATDPVTDFLVGEGVFTDRDQVTLEPMSGGVSSDIWLATAGGQRVVVKTPLAKLNVAADWHAPVTRSASEAEWLRVVSDLVPGVCPEVLAYDADQHLLALSYLDPSEHRLWKSDLLAGRVEVAVAALVGDRIGAIHRLTSSRPDLAVTFANDDLFRALRIQPYLEQVVVRHPELRGPIGALIDETMSTRVALVHGDLSPKNILVGPDGPVLLDAETAWWGDPAFDVAFCVNHLLLKCLLPVSSVQQLTDAAHGFVRGYLAHVTWEDSEELLGRVVRLLPALMLARVDGRSPVDYLEPADQDTVRRFARRQFDEPAIDLAHLTQEWKASLS
jgi:tRNA A-37 threonylcarbamoyl transferase component Bud32